MFNIDNCQVVNQKLGQINYKLPMHFQRYFYEKYRIIRASLLKINELTLVQK